MGAKKRRYARIVPAENNVGHFELLHRKRLALLQWYAARRGWENFTAQTIVDGVRIGQWASGRRSDYFAGKLPKWLEHELQRIRGWEWNPIQGRHERHLAVLRDHVSKQGDFPRRGQIAIDGADLRVWMNYCRRGYRAGVLPGWLVDELGSIPGWSWYPSRGRFPHDKIDDTMTRTPARLLKIVQQKLDKTPREAIDEVATVVYWIDKVTDEKRERLPEEIFVARKREGWARPKESIDTGSPRRRKRT